MSSKAIIQTGEFIGFIGLDDVDFTIPTNKLTSAVEIGWRLAFKYWEKAM
jgi:RimJ/RimL family protein N-acetyltransferase